MKEGTKYDTGKPRIGEMLKDFAPAISEVARVWEFGANKYEKSNWKKVENGIDRYTNAMMRHLLSEDTEITDPETGLFHATHVAWNALARLCFIILQERQLKPLETNMFTLPEGAFDIEMFNNAMLHTAGEKLREQMNIQDDE